MSTNILFGFQKNFIHILKNFSRMISFFFDFITAEALYLEECSIRWSKQVLLYLFVHSFKSIAFVSLNTRAVDRPTTGLKGCLLYFRQFSQASITLFNISSIPLSQSQHPLEVFEIYWILQGWIANVVLWHCITQYFLLLQNSMTSESCLIVHALLSVCNNALMY